ncbi:unnamed protein product [Absidia cylindrospora]
MMDLDLQNEDDPEQGNGCYVPRSFLILLGEILIKVSSWKLYLICDDEIQEGSSALTNGIQKILQNKTCLQVLYKNWCL